MTKPAAMAMVGAQRHPVRHLVQRVQDVVVRAVEDRLAPELVLALADEVAA